MAIVGQSGSGKTTLMNLLMRYFDCDGGDIKIDGISVKDMPRYVVNELFSLVSQDIWVFSGTYRENIVYNSEPPSDEELLKLCDSMGLGFIRDLPDGLDTVIENPDTLSKGRKQQITIARSLLRKAPILILDEATSSIDVRTEKAIFETIRQAEGVQTTFIIAHRLSTVRDADVIIVMQNGKIREIGSPEELMRNKGMFYKLNHAYDTKPEGSRPRLPGHDVHQRTDVHVADTEITSRRTYRDVVSFGRRHLRYPHPVKRIVAYVVSVQYPERLRRYRQARTHGLHVTLLRGPHPAEDVVPVGLVHRSDELRILLRDHDMGIDVPAVLYPFYVHADVGILLRIGDIGAGVGNVESDAFAEGFAAVADGHPAVSSLDRRDDEPGGQAQASVLSEHERIRQLPPPRKDHPAGRLVQPRVLKSGRIDDHARTGTVRIGFGIGTTREQHGRQSRCFY